MHINETVYAGKPGRTCILRHTVTLYKQVRLPSLPTCWIEPLPVMPCQPSVLPHNARCFERLDGKSSHSGFMGLQEQLSVLPPMLQGPNTDGRVQPSRSPTDEMTEGQTLEPLNQSV